MFQTFKKILYLLTPKEHKNARLLLVMILFVALIDMIGIASILPFMAVLVNPGLIETNIVLNIMYQVSGNFGVENQQQFLFTLGILVFLILITSLSLKALTTYFELRFIQMTEYRVSQRLLKIYLCQPYSWFLNRHSADLGKAILSEVSIIIGNGIHPMLDLIAKSIVALTLIILLIIVDPKLAFIVSFTLSLAYVIIYKFARSYLSRIGLERVKANQQRFTSISDAFGAFKELKLGGLEQSFINQFAISAKTFAKHQASSQTIKQLPRYFLEAIAFGGMLLVILYLITRTGTLANAIPVIALYVFAGYRLMPALQQIFGAIAQLRFVNPSIEAMYKDIKSLEKYAEEKNKKSILFNSKINLNYIRYAYPNSSRTSLKDISLSITASTTVGIVGTTGSGKTTMVDIILGLLQPQQGTLEVDDKIINKDNIRAWQNLIGYVPQNIYLSDSTIASNIAFGAPYHEINQEAVETAAKIANLHAFVINELPKKYFTSIGERGIRLSGGQRQRIGIARALYHNPKVLILDEATSSLDNITEKAVLDEIHNIKKDMTIIMIAHRLSTVKKCDNIFLLEKGNLVSQGKFEELIKTNHLFQVTNENNQKN